MSNEPIAVSGGLRTNAEQVEASRNRALFEANPSTWETKVENFPKYVRRQNLTRFLEPVNLMRRIYGFDTFEGFPGISEQDRSATSQHVKEGDLAADVFDELTQLVEIYDSTRFIGHVNKVQLVRGDATKTIPAFVEENPHLLVSLLYLDFDLYEPTKVALEHFLPRMPRGAVVAFDELDNPLWPGETLAMLETHAKRPLRIERFDFDPYIGFAILD